MNKICPKCSSIGVPFELKCSYQSSSRPLEENHAWLRQLMAQCYVTHSLQGRLSRLEIMGDWGSVYLKGATKAEKEAYRAEHQKPDLHAYRFEFTQEELDDNWAWTKARRDLFQGLLDNRCVRLLPKEMALPSGQASFECSYCPSLYKERCGGWQ